MNKEGQTTLGFQALCAQKGNHQKPEHFKVQYAQQLAELRDTFASGKTKGLKWRREQLRAIMKMVEENTDAIAAATQADLGGAKVRSIFELDAHAEAVMALENLSDWAADEHVKDENFNGTSLIRREPKGVVLVLAPWNFPISLCLRPLVSIVAAGNCCIIKPSEVSANCSKLIAQLIPRYMDKSAFRVIEGAVPETTALLALRWDHILYTGNSFVARIVMKAAAEHLTPVTLELGGKSPVFVDASAKLRLAAKRLVLAKFAANAGQVCIAPDYILVDEKVEKDFLQALKDEIDSQFGSGPHNKFSEADKDVHVYGKIINSRHATRIKKLLDNCGGTFISGNPDDINEEECYIPPLVISNPNRNSKLLVEEIFGPVLPVVGVKSMESAIEICQNVCDHPLALYIFSQSSKQTEKILQTCTSGGACVNSAIEHVINPLLPFGGVGESGMGSYHGKYGFDEFSHRRSILYRTTLLPLTALPTSKDGKYPSYLYTLALKMGVTGFLPFGRTKVKLLKMVC